MTQIQLSLGNVTDRIGSQKDGAFPNCSVSESQYTQTERKPSSAGSVQQSKTGEAGVRLTNQLLGSWEPGRHADTGQFLMKMLGLKDRGGIFMFFLEVGRELLKTALFWLLMGSSGAVMALVGVPLSMEIRLQWG